MSITFSAQEITALLLEVEKNDTPTDVLTQARHKLTAEYHRITGDALALEIFHDVEDRQEIKHSTPHQQELIDGYYALDPGARCIGYYKSMPVIHAYTAPIRMRSESSRRNVVIVTRDGAPQQLPRTGWADNFIPAQGVAWAEAETIITDWIVHNQSRLVS